MVKLQYTGNQFIVTIPKEYADQANLVKGDTMTININEHGNIELKKVE